jgi:hypothetical protein
MDRRNTIIIAVAVIWLTVTVMLLHLGVQRGLLIPGKFPQ